MDLNKTDISGPIGQADEVKQSSSARNIFGGRSIGSTQNKTFIDKEVRSALDDRHTAGLQQAFEE